MLVLKNILNSFMLGPGYLNFLTLFIFCYSLGYKSTIHLDYDPPVMPNLEIFGDLKTKFVHDFELFSQVFLEWFE